MQQRDIAGPDPVDQFHRVSGQHSRVVIGVRSTQGPAGKVAVDLVVQPFGDREELSVAGDHQPADRDADTADVADQHLQHLGDPAAHRGRADVPDGAPRLQPPHLVRGLDQPQIAFAADNGLQ